MRRNPRKSNRIRENPVIIRKNLTESEKIGKQSERIRRESQKNPKNKRESGKMQENMRESN